ncbi:abnormal spindle-like microcephaly-associated protein homolog [Saccostrea echinata]|uniref:abnormal spindle-like microcephaly-associated protein homolog n=1 Tax=Saccostrea echinata TaxID=191078 RepID=UPI002A81088C|nr:abnormal spindle-like microcephaly-associated protein homolog [Saccostrea echinata]
MNMNDSLDFDPAALNSLATSTPKPSKLSNDRSGRRSWFEKPTGITYSIAVENKEKYDARRNSDVELETLVLTHFTTSPKIGFGICKVGIPKRRTLIVKNPHDYPQSVKIERIPHKNIFSFDSIEFIVDGESMYNLEISFNPENEGNFREMIQFSIDNAYRLQAFVFGTCQKPQKKKIVTRKGLLNQKVKRPLSVVYTQSLANIAKSYSPDKSEKDSVCVKSLRKDENKLQTSGKLSIKRELKSSKKNHRRSNTYNSSDQGEMQNKSQERSQENRALSVDKENDENKENQGKTPETDKRNLEQMTDVDNESSEHQQTIVEETCTNVISPDTFLKNLSGQGLGEGEIGMTGNCNDTPSTIPTTKGCISPNTFLQDLNETKENLQVNSDQDHSSSVDDVLNKSVPHDVMLSQLEFVKSNLKWKMSNSLCLNASKEGSMSETTDERALTFVASNIPNNAFSIVPEGSSPRRTTYTVKRKRSPCKTMTKVMQRRVARDKVTVNHSKDGYAKNVKPQMEGRGKAPKRRRSGSFTPRAVRKTESLFHLTENVGKSTLTEPTPERMAKEKHVFDTPDNICLTPEILKISKNPCNMLPEKEPSNWVLPTPERILLNASKMEGNTKTPLSHHYRSLNLLTPEQSLQKMGPGEIDVGTTCSKQTLSLDNFTSDKGSLTYLPDSPLQQAITHEVSETNLKEVSVLEERQPSVCLFSQSGEKGQRTSDSPCTSESLEGSFIGTPLPTSPNPDMSRRSTHIIQNPRVVNSSQMEKKRLFPPLDTLDNEELEDKENIPLRHTSPDTCIDNVCGTSPLKKQGFSFEEKEKGDRNSRVDQCPKPETISTSSDYMNDPSKSIGSYEQSCNENLLKLSEVKGIAAKNDNDKTCLKLDNCTKQSDGYFHHISVSESCVNKDASLVPLKQGLSVESKVKKAKGVGVFENHSEKSKIIKKQEISKKGQVSQKCKTDEAGVQRQKVTASVQRQTAKPKTAGIAKSKLILMKKTKTALPKHPLPFASKNIYYDERWMEKQERGFSHWLNFILTPSTEMGNNTKCKVDASKLDFYKTGPHKLAPTKEALSFREYSASRKLNGLRRSACKLFQSETVTMVVRKLEMEVESRRLMIRKDRKIHADLGLRQSILDLLLSFNPLWLRVGLETVFGEIISIKDNSDVIGLSHFIITRVLGNPDIAFHFAHPSVPHLYKEGYSEAIAQHFLKKFLLLVYFLDHAKCQLLIKHDPCLFCRDSDFKSCKALLVEFSSHFLAGEGDINRHLGYLGCITGHTQTALDEFDYAIQNLCTDLRDGLRLIRILDLLEEKAPLKRKLRVPAISRLQKIHNMDVAFSILKDIGIDMERDVKKVTSRDIVDGHKEKTLHLLWMIILKYQIGLILNVDQLKEEISALERSLQLRKHLQALKNYEMGLQHKRRESTCDDLYSNNELLASLLKWCRTVCLFYGLKVENFTVSFSDGQALCFLVHHYHPDLLPQTLISTKTSMTYQEEMEHQTLDCSLSDSPAPMSVSADQDVFKDLLKNERENFKVLHQKVSELGGVPMMIKAADMSNTIPDEKVVVTYVSYLCARLLDIREECRAARTIQLAWRRHYLHRARAKLQVQEKAAIKIQRFIKCHRQRTLERKQQYSAIIIQRCVRQYLARKKLRQMMEEKRLRAARVLKNYLLTCMERKHFLSMKASAIKIQCVVRGFLVRQQLAKEKSAVRLIENWYLLSKQSKQLRANFLHKKQCIITIQRAVRKFRERRKSEKERAAIVLQKTWRAYCVKCWYKKTQASITVIQRALHAWKQRKNFLRKRKAVLFLQQKYRAHQLAKRQRATFIQIKSSSIVIQQAWKRHLEKCTRAATKIQSYWRCFMALRKYRIVRKGVVATQAAFRVYSARKLYLSQHRAVITIQGRWKEILVGRQIRQRFLAQKAAVITIQATFKGHQVRKQFLQTRFAVIIFQKSFRRLVTYKKFQLMKESTVKIQRKWRATQHMKQIFTQYQIVKQSVLAVQSYFRGYRVRKAIGVIRQREAAAQLIQKSWRGYSIRKKYLTVKNCAKIIQTAYRSWKLRKDKEQKCKAAIILQRRYRAILSARLHRKSFLQVRSACCTIQKQWRMKVIKRNHAAITIQSQWRTYAAQKRFRDIKKCVISIQTAYRAWKSRKDYILKRNAAVILQQKYREYRRGKAQRKSFLISKGAALTIQAFYRGYQERKRFRTLKRSVIIIQAHFRGSQERHKYLSKKSAALTIQKRFREILRARRERRYFLLQKGAAISIQASYKAYRARKKFIKVHSAVVRLQSVVRTYLQKKRYKDFRDRVCTIQRKWRATLMMRNARLQFMMVKGAAVTVQAFYRKCQAQQEFQKTKTSIIKLQSFIRRCLVQKEYMKIKQSVCVIQRQFRAYMDMKQTQKEYLILKGAVITIQACFRGYLERHHYRKKRAAIVKLQSGVRKFLCQRNYARLRRTVLGIQRQFRQKMCAARVRENFFITKGAAITIQAHYRRHIQQRDYNHKRQAVIKLQAFTCMKIHRDLFLIKKRAACQIQKWYRNKLQGDRVQTEYQIKRQSVIIIQSAFRGWIARKQAKQRKMSIIHIQAIVRKFITVQKFQILKKYTEICQRRYRAKLHGRFVRHQYLALCKAAVTMQSCYRGKQTRRLMSLKQESARRIQSWYKGRKQCILYMKLRKSVLLCQKIYRTRRLAQSDQRKFLALKGAALTIQAVYKGYKTRCMYQRMKQAIVLLQAATRGFLNRRRLKKRHEAATIIQRGFRKHLHSELVKRHEKERQAYLVQFAKKVQIHMAAMVIQRSYKKYVSLCQAKKQLQSVLIIQNWMRGRICRLRFLKLKRSIFVIETAALKWIQIQHNKEKHQAATTVQAVWRGRQVRMKNKCKKMEMVRQRVVEAHRTATEDKKLGNRTESALDYLLQYKQLSHLLEALVHLDVATRLSPACCERLVEVNAVSVIYTLISSCNRSQPHMEVIKMAVSILLNLAKYDRTLPSVFVEGALNILLDLMQIYREKGIIFNRTCTLVGILGRDECRRKTILSQPRVTERLQSLYKLTARKYKLHENQQMRQAKLNASKVFNYSLPIRATPHKLPKIRPDWVLHRGSLHNIDNPMQAITFVMDSLCIGRS